MSIFCTNRTCVDECTVKYQKTCSSSGKLITPKIPIPVKFLQLFLKERILFQGVESFLHFLLRCFVKTHAEGVAESMGNYIDLHSDKRRGMEIDDVGKEAMVHWNGNGPPILFTWLRSLELTRSTESLRELTGISSPRILRQTLQ